MLTQLVLDNPVFETRQEKKNFSLLENTQSGSGAYPASYSKGTKTSLPEGCSGQSMKLTNHTSRFLRFYGAYRNIVTYFTYFATVIIIIIVILFLRYPPHKFC